MIMKLLSDILLPQVKNLSLKIPFFTPRVALCNARDGAFRKQLPVPLQGVALTMCMVSPVNFSTKRYA